ncbi:MAG: ParB/RepB/Spo0J family partition protein, partial [Caldisericum sp.]|nr:ParB/RepB/Spo0J family partition protein [Caldisericum sp.]
MPSSKRVPLEADSVFYKHLSVENISLIDIDDIIPDPNQPRKHFSEESLNELASSIKEKGLLQPIIVRKSGDKYVIVAGERRWRACKIAGLNKIKCIIKDVKSEEEIREVQIIENLQREDVSPIERSKALQEYLSLMLHADKSEVLKIVSNYRFNKCNEEEKNVIEKVLKVIGKSAKTLERWLMLLTLPEDIQQKIDSPDSPITAKHIENIVKLKDENLVREVVNLIEKENLSSEETKAVVDKIRKKKTQDPIDVAIKSLKAVSAELENADSGEKEEIKDKLHILK